MKILSAYIVLSFFTFALAKDIDNADRSFDPIGLAVQYVDGRHPQNELTEISRCTATIVSRHLLLASGDCFGWRRNSVHARYYPRWRTSVNAYNPYGYAESLASGGEIDSSNPSTWRHNWKFLAIPDSVSAYGFFEIKNENFSTIPVRNSFTLDPFRSSPLTTMDYQNDFSGGLKQLDDCMYLGTVTPGIIHHKCDVHVADSNLGSPILVNENNQWKIVGINLGNERWHNLVKTSYIPAIPSSEFYETYASLKAQTDSLDDNQMESFVEAGLRKENKWTNWQWNLPLSRVLR